ncbi:MAG: 3-deoxy-manno-octulosonate cytidylyltransferase [Clostridiales bacterium]|jgi:3-deoxy-manno-octulosonate cytidylyltransferase (CMP-KDO synthetase)|nr:3-deoxy-manno-octulosonate cytidylyltransferase [Clostridiales bacterium]
MKTVGVIPARYASFRFPGKPLADIHGKPMVWWVYRNAKSVKELSEVYVATESNIIADECAKYDIPVIMTSDNCPTGTDRVAEVAQQISADLYCVIMGDEPLVKASDVCALIEKARLTPQTSAVMIVRRFDHLPDIVNNTTIKIALNNDGRVIFMSRSPIPYPKASLDFDYYKNIGAYIFTKDVLDFYLQTPVGALEQIEEIELLRLLENGKYVQAVIVESDSLSVDTPKDLERAKKILGTGDKP